MSGLYLLFLPLSCNNQSVAVFQTEQARVSCGFVEGVTRVLPWCYQFVTDSVRVLDKKRRKVALLSFSISFQT